MSVFFLYFNVFMRIYRMCSLSMAQLYLFCVWNRNNNLLCVREKSLYYTNSKVNFVFFFSWKEFSVIFLMKKKKVFWQSVFYHHHHRHFLGNWMNLVFIFAYTWEDTVQHIQKKWYYNRAQQKKKWCWFWFIIRK